MPKELVMAELTKHHVTEVKIRKRKHKTFKVVRITIVSQRKGKASEEIELTLHTDQKFPSMKIGKIEHIG